MAVISGGGVLRTAAPGIDSSNRCTISEVALRFSEPVRVPTVTPATVVLFDPTGRVESSVAIAESGLLAFVMPRVPLAPDTTYTLALAGVTDTAGHGLAAFTTTFTTVKASGEPPTIASFAPTAGSEGDEVKITGTNLLNVSSVRFGGITATQFTPVSA